MTPPTRSSPHRGNFHTLHIRHDEGQPLGLRLGRELVDERLLVEEVLAGSAAARHGLEAGDVIERVNGAAFASASDAAKALRASRGEVEIVITSRERAAGEAPLAPPRRLVRMRKSAEERLGVRLGGELENGSLVVDEVAPGSIAERGGLHPGDLIASVNGVAGTNPLKAADGLRGFAGDVNLMIERRPRGLSGASAAGISAAAPHKSTGASPQPGGEPRPPLRGEATTGAPPARACGGAAAHLAGAGLHPTVPHGLHSFKLLGTAAMGGLGGLVAKEVVLRKRGGERLGMRFDELPGSHMPAGHTPRPILVVRDVLPGSVADEAGVSAGDQVRSINGAIGLSALDAAKLVRDARSEVVILLAGRAQRHRPRPAADSASHAIGAAQTFAAMGAAAPRCQPHAAATAPAGGQAVDGQTSRFGLAHVWRRLPWALPARQRTAPSAAGAAGVTQQPPDGSGGVALGIGSGVGGQHGGTQPPTACASPRQLRAAVKLQALARGFVARRAAGRLRERRALMLEYREWNQQQRREEVAACSIQAILRGQRGRARAREARAARAARAARKTATVQ